MIKCLQGWFTWHTGLCCSTLFHAGDQRVKLHENIYCTITTTCVWSRKQHSMYMSRQISETKGRSGEKDVNEDLVRWIDRVIIHNLIYGELYITSLMHTNMFMEMSDILFQSIKSWYSKICVFPSCINPYWKTDFLLIRLK